MLVGDTETLKSEQLSVKERWHRFWTLKTTNVDKYDYGTFGTIKSLYGFKHSITLNIYSQYGNKPWTADWYNRSGELEP